MDIYKDVNVTNYPILLLKRAKKIVFKGFNGNMLNY